MSATDTINPPVVAVMVVHEPGPWFTEVLDSLVLQDYANLRTLVLVSGDSDEAVELVNQRLPDAVIRQVAGDPGFGASANEVLDLVEGDNGFFCFLHDDVALERSTIRLLVEELYRSNAGIVGPKLVEWEDRRILQRVGLGVDAFGEVDTYLQPGEADQEQHDSVSDVFALPSACMLIRADLFRALRGFSPSIRFHGDDVELCWRAHLGGARQRGGPAGPRSPHRRADHAPPRSRPSGDGGTEPDVHGGDAHRRRAAAAGHDPPSDPDPRPAHRRVVHRDRRTRLRRTARHRRVDPACPGHHRPAP
ncbi:MAG: glycosyltransferase [Ilumatobacteraceae bacterium]